MDNIVYDFCDSMINHYRDLSEEAGNRYLEWQGYFCKACEELSYYQAKLYGAEKKLYELGYNEYAIPNDIEPMDKFEWMRYIMNKEDSEPLDETLSHKKHSVELKIENIRKHQSDFSDLE